ncbi:SAM-dependent methyltransferase [Aurantiacibacter aquimixticola]|uniref:SAM-dependent methyltransferase n=1 Tax=Aurantiacibacter aquimixticola TaxID=1958945 RepID=UPI0018F86C1A|nr:class I SAM-dependent methyltransferase [Aurantiacibacter aquimixticola]
MAMIRKALSMSLATVMTFGLLGLVAYTLDGSAVRQALGITPALDVPYVESRRNTVEAMLDMADVTAEERVIDLGTGDGRILIAAARDYGARGVGVDLDPTLVEEARANAAAEGLAERVEFREEDLFDTPLADADVVTMFLLPEVNMRLRPRLLEELRPGTRIVSNRFDMGDWRPDEVRRVSGYPVYLWIVPADVRGRWMLQVDGREIVLELEQAFQDLTGEATIDGEPALVTGEVRGEQVRLEFPVGGEERVFEGAVQGGRIGPTDGSTWQAVRRTD